MLCYIYIHKFRLHQTDSLIHRHISSWWGLLGRFCRWTWAPPHSPSRHPHRHSPSANYILPKTECISCHGCIGSRHLDRGQYPVHPPPRDSPGYRPPTSYCLCIYLKGDSGINPVDRLDSSVRPLQTGRNLSKNYIYHYADAEVVKTPAASYFLG